MADLLNDSRLRRRTLLAAVLAAGAAPLAGCASKGGSAAPALVVAKGVRREAAAADAPVGPAVAGMAAFGHALLAATAAPGQNWVASPLSIACAFSMIRAGAKGATAASLDRFFGYPATGRDDAFNAITRAVVTTDRPPAPAKGPRSAESPSDPPVVAIGNAVFPSRGLPVEPAFLTTLAAKYGAGVRPVDFGTPDALKQINGWVNTQTAGRIKKVFEQLDPDTALVLANTIYLRAAWQNLFESVSDGPFTRADGRPVTVPTMRSGLFVPYAGREGWAAISLPFAKTDRLSMWFLLPPTGGGPADMLAPARLAEVAGGLADRPVDVLVPRFEFATGIDLSETLTRMGLSDVFGRGDFSGITAGLNGVSQAVHKATITVDEFGTEAAAVTGIAFPSSAMMPAAEFHADRPFAFAIVDGPTRTPLFTGVVADPAQK